METVIYFGDSSVAYSKDALQTSLCRCPENYNGNNRHYFSPVRCGICNSITNNSSRESYREEKPLKTFVKQAFLARKKQRKKKGKKKKKKKKQDMRAYFCDELGFGDQLFDPLRGDLCDPR